MLIDRYAPEDVFARVPEMAAQVDPVLHHLDHLLEDDTLYAQTRADLGKRYPQTLQHGRHSTPAEAILRLILVKHLYNWSYRETVTRVADSLVLRWFCRVYFRRVPVAATLLRWAHTIQPTTLDAMNDQVVHLAQQAKVTQGRKLRIDGTVVQAAIHHPTDAHLLTDGVRVLSRLIRRSKPLVYEQLSDVRDAFRTRTRTMRRGIQQMQRLTRQARTDQRTQRQVIYRTLLAVADQTMRQAQRVQTVLRQFTEETPRLAQRLTRQLARFVPLVARVIDQTQRRVLVEEKVPAREKLVSLFEPHARIIPRNKGGAPVEFGRLVVFDETEGGIVTRFAVLADKTAEQGQLAPSLDHHQGVFTHPPRLVVGDRGLHAAENERIAQDAGVAHVVIPRSGTLTAAQRAREHDPSWRRRYRWRSGIEGRLSSLRRDYGLRRCPDHGENGLIRRVGWGVIASNLRHVGRKLAA